MKEFTSRCQKTMCAGQVMSQCYFNYRTLTNTETVTSANTKTSLMITITITKMMIATIQRE